MVVKIGILLTYPKQEVKKADLVTHDASLPWTQHADTGLVMERKLRSNGMYYQKIKRHRDGRHGIPTDVAVGCFLRHISQKAGNVKVDFILPHEITAERLRANDLNFLLIYDLLEAFHTDKSKGKRIYNQVEKTLIEATNIFPPFNYQQFVYSKIKYYNYLKEHGICIAPTSTMTSEEYRKLGHAKAVAKVMKHIKDEGWDEFVAKPVYGQESKDVRFLLASHRKRLEGHIRKCMARYPGMVMQKTIKSHGEYFGGNSWCPELRMYYVGNRYKYSACCADKVIITPESEGGKLKAPMTRLVKATRGILRKLPPIVMPNGTRLPRLITRLDMGYLVDGHFSPFVNEVEFVPSLYSEDVRVELVHNYIKEVAIQMLRITRRYIKSREVPCPPSGGRKRRLKAAQQPSSSNKSARRR